MFMDEKEEEDDWWIGLRIAFLCFYLLTKGWSQGVGRERTVDVGEVLYTDLYIAGN
jgi:hypothetical protein